MSRGKNISFVISFKGFEWNHVAGGLDAFFGVFWLMLRVVPLEFLGLD